MSLQVIKLQHYQGERLRAADLRDDDQELTTFRALHIRALHDAWGIAVGLEVYLVGGETFAVTAGLAYDRLGRELLLPIARTTPDFVADAGDGVYQLVLTRESTAQPELRWMPSVQTRLGLDVPLLAVHIVDGSLTGVDFTVRQFAQPMSRPHIAYGLTPTEQRWTVWSKGGGERKVGFGMRVDTSSQGFVATPLYVARLVQSGNALFVGQPNATQVQMYVFSSIGNATPTGFTLRVSIGGVTHPAASGAQAPPDVHGIYRRFIGGNLPFRVAWMGVEPMQACASASLEGIA